MLAADVGDCDDGFSGAGAGAASTHTAGPWLLPTAAFAGAGEGATFVGASFAGAVGSQPSSSSVQLQGDVVHRHEIVMCRCNNNGGNRTCLCITFVQLQR